MANRTLTYTIGISFVIHSVILFGYLPDWSSSLAGEGGTEPLIVSFGSIGLPKMETVEVAPARQETITVPPDNQPVHPTTEPEPTTTVKQPALPQPEPLISTPTPGAPKLTAGQQADLQSSYEKKIYEKLHRTKHYPEEARRNQWSGSTVVEFTISSTGMLLQKKLLEFSGYEILDKEALDWLNRAEPYPPIPPELGQTEFKISLRLTFSLKE